jgi:hypothetical protein
MKSIAPQSPVVNRSRNISKPQSQPDVATSLVPLLVQRKGQPDHIFWAPVCASCRKPITNLKLANVACVNDNWSGPDEVLVAKPGLKISRLGETPAAVYCKSHDVGGVPWEEASYVFARKGRG